MTDVSIPHSVERIGKRAFSYCTRLASVNIPNSLQTIDEGAFANCAELENITIPDGAKTIGERAFEDCVSLTGVIEIPNSVKTMGTHILGKKMCIAEGDE